MNASDPKRVSMIINHHSYEAKTYAFTRGRVAGSAIRSPGEDIPVIGVTHHDGQPHQEFKGFVFARGGGNRALSVQALM